MYNENIKMETLINDLTDKMALRKDIKMTEIQNERNNRFKNLAEKRT